MSLFIYQPGQLSPQTSITEINGGLRADFTGGKTANAYLAELNANRPTGSPEFQILKYEKMLEYIEKAESSLMGDWREISEEDYTEALNTLPPEKWETVRGVEFFRMSEYYTGNITAHYARLNGKFFTAYRRTSDSYADLAGQVTWIFLLYETCGAGRGDLKHKS